MTEPGTHGGHWESLAREAGQRVVAAGGAPLRELLLFQLEGDPYGLPIERVREIVRLRPITPVPRLPAAIRGVISLRGEIVQVVDLRSRLGLEPAVPSRRSRIVVLRGDEGSVTGLLVDQVRAVLRLGEDAIQALPAAESELVTALCTRGEDFVSLLDLERVLDFDGRS